MRTVARVYLVWRDLDLSTTEEARLQDTAAALAKEREQKEIAEKKFLDVQAFWWSWCLLAIRDGPSLAPIFN